MKTQTYRIPIENNSWDYVQGLIEKEISSAFKLRIEENKMEELLETKCCVCNRTYKEKEIGWTYRSFYKVYVCSTKCYEIAEGGWRDGKNIMVGGINVN